MRTTLSLFLVLLFSTVTIAQRGINYKAIIKDATGNVVANDLIAVQFAILKTSESGTIVYEESHTTTTDANGTIIIDIGEGTPLTGTFNSIDWGSDDHFLNVQVNIGAGLVDLGTTEFKSVPYALNVTGLEKITEGSNTGWRLIGRDPADFGNIGNNAVDFSTQSVMPDVGATGASSFAVGQDTYSSGLGSGAFGLENVASGLGSIVGGFDSAASGDHAMAVGNNAIASGQNSAAFGDETRAMGGNSFAVGSLTEAIAGTSAAFGTLTKASGLNSFSTGTNTEAIGINATAMGEDTKVSASNALAVGINNFDNDFAAFMVGNGTDISNRNNAFTVMKDGRVGVGIALPVNPFSVLQPTGTTNTVRIESLDHPAGKDLLELQIPAGSTSGSQFIEMQNGGNIVAVVNGDGSAIFEKLSLDGSGSGKLHINQNSQAVGTGLRFDDGTANSDWDITHGFALRFHYGGALRGFINANTGAYTQSSDIRLKSNVEALPSVINKIEKLRPTTYIYNTDESNKQAIGLIAQEVQKIFPEVVHYSEADDLYGIDYSAFGVIAIKAIQDQQKIIENQEKRLQALEAKINN